MSQPKVVLAFSGGLDTSFCVKYLAEDKGYEVHSVLVDTGGFSDEELKTIEANAYALGVKQHATITKTSDYYNDCIKYLIFGNRFSETYVLLQANYEDFYPGYFERILESNSGCKSRT